MSMFYEYIIFMLYYKSMSMEGILCSIFSIYMLYEYEVYGICICIWYCLLVVYVLALFHTILSFVVIIHVV